MGQFLRRALLLTRNQVSNDDAWPVVDAAAHIVSEHAAFYHNNALSADSSVFEDSDVCSQ